MLRVDFFFFFQAEDGIRDVAVTGVQTCALPICEILELKNTINVMVDQLNAFAGEVTRVAREVGTERSEEHTSELQSRLHLVCRLLLEKKKKKTNTKKMYSTPQQSVIDRYHQQSS